MTSDTARSSMIDADAAKLTRCLRAHGVVAIATESSFGLLADVRSAEAIDALFCMKPRDIGRGVGLVVPDNAEWRALVADVPPLAERLIARFWPGPLSLVLPASSIVDRRLCADGSIALRVPGPSPAAALVARFGGPLTATSANQPGQPPALDGAHVQVAFPEAFSLGVVRAHDAVAPGGAPSTLVQVVDGAWRVLRAGAVSQAQLEDATSTA